MDGSNNAVADRGSGRPRTEWERERKFVASEKSVARLLEAIAPHARETVHDPSRPVSYNRTTYLDTDDLAFLRSARAPIFRKLRVREYASAPSPDAPPRLSGTCFFELKESGGSFRTKTRVRTDPALVARLLRQRSPGFPDPAMDRSLAWFVRLFREDALSPRLTTWYRRVSFDASDPPARITIDSGLSFSGPVEIGSEEPSARPEGAVRVPFSVVEVKLARDVPAWLARALEPLREVPGFSKYRQGMAQLRPEVA